MTSSGAMMVISVAAEPVSARHQRRIHGPVTVSAERPFGLGAATIGWAGALRQPSRSDLTSRSPSAFVVFGLVVDRSSGVQPRFVHAGSRS
jgi:hypothetical protein